jgi:hypothetical protein
VVILHRPDKDLENFSNLIQFSRARKMSSEVMEFIFKYMLQHQNRNKSNSNNCLANCITPKSKQLVKDGHKQLTNEIQRLQSTELCCETFSCRGVLVFFYAINCVAKIRPTPIVFINVLSPIFIIYYIAQL